MVRPPGLGRWPRLVWAAPLVLKACVINLLCFHPEIYPKDVIYNEGFIPVIVPNQQSGFVFDLCAPEGDTPSTLIYSANTDNNVRASISYLIP